MFRYVALCTMYQCSQGKIQGGRSRGRVWGQIQGADPGGGSGGRSRIPSFSLKKFLDLPLHAPRGGGGGGGGGRFHRPCTSTVTGVKTLVKRPRSKT